MNEELTVMIFRMVVSICVALITAYVIPYIKALKNDSRYSKVIDMVALAVRSAEQTITDPKSGALKKSKVTGFIKNWLDQEGITMTDDEINEIIESAVYSMKNAQQQVKE